MTELWRSGPTELAEQVRSKQASAREVVQSFLDRIQDVNPKVNAVTLTLEDSALAAAAEVDRRVAAGEDPGPFAGVPLTVKENIDCVGSATTLGVVAMAEALPLEDAPQLAHLRSAGAIPLARTNLPDLGLRWHTDNELRGATRNPWNANVTAGGSSGGEGAALATGMSCLGLGNDLGGSLRVPAHFNGIASIKPTFGRVPNASSLPPTEGPIGIQLMAVEGPMARRVGDLRTALRVMSQPSARDPWYVPAPMEGPPVPSPIRVAMVGDPGGFGVDPQVAAGVRKAGVALAAAGYAVEEAEPPDVAGTSEAWVQLVNTDVALIRALIEPWLGKDAIRFLEVSLGPKPVLDLAGYEAAMMARQGLLRAWLGFFEQYPLVIGPVCTRPPFTVGTDLEAAEADALIDSMRFVACGNVLGLPAAVVPVGVEGGLPQAVQIYGGRFREDLCLDAADAVEAACGVLAPIDPR